MRPVLTFRPVKPEVEIPMPFNFKPGQKYVSLSFEGSSSVPLGFSPSTTFVILEGVFHNGAWHALNTPLGSVIAKLFFIPGEKVRVESCHPEYPCRISPRSELDILGAVTEVYPEGLKGCRYVLEPKRVKVGALLRPVFSASATL